MPVIDICHLVYRYLISNYPETTCNAMYIIESCGVIIVGYSGPINWIYFRG